MATSRAPLHLLLALSACWAASAVWAQSYPVTPSQSATARQIAQTGVPLGELATDAPDQYTVRSGDTLWAVSSLFLRSPWRWPELWGMNLDDIRNPHLIYPGQRLVLLRRDGYASLRLAGGAQGEPADLATVRLSPRVRSAPLNDALTTLQTQAIEPFLAEPVIVEENELSAAPRIVATQENRVMLSRGDRAYARGPSGAPLLATSHQIQRLRVFREATPLKDPGNGEVLGYEAQFLGIAELVRGESTQTLENRNGPPHNAIVPASLNIVSTREEIRVGDRMLPEPAREFMSYTPHAPSGPVSGRIVSVYGSAVVNAAQNQVVVINRGRRDGLESGHVLAILKDGQQLVDRTDPTRPQLKLPDERNGLLMVFKTFDKLSYALVLDITDSVRVGDRLAAPR